MTVTTSNWRHRRRFLVLGGALTAAVAVAGLAPPALARPSAPAATATVVRGPGYPPPRGIYRPFTNCPLNNPVMHEVMPLSDPPGGYAACTAGEVVGGSITLGNITTQVSEPVNVQFGFFIPPRDPNIFPALAVPPLAGPSVILSTKPDLIPESLTTGLGCATAADVTIVNICRQAEARGGVYNQVYALAQEAGQLRDFNLFDWIQPVKFKLINPLLGSNCYIGTDSDPVVVHPSLSVGPGGGFFSESDPQPAVHPDTIFFGVTGAVASDSTFSAPGVLGCGPGGVANVAVDEALDASSGLPAASGNSLTLNGNFLVSANFGAEDSSMPQPQDAAANLLAAFKASTNGEHSVKHQITMSQFKRLLH